VTAGYDTKEQTKRKEFDLAVWAINAQVAGRATDAHFVVHETAEYMARVIAIVQSRRPHQISYSTYESLAINGNDGESFADTVMKLGMSVQEVRRRSVGSIETLMYQWTNADGSHVLAIFQNQRLVSKAQTGLE
jgi:hypothetical protein